MAAFMPTTAAGEADKNRALRETGRCVHRHGKIVRQIKVFGKYHDA
jgi:hypothetical protein